MLDPGLIWADGDTTDNMQSYAKDVVSLKGRAREEVLLMYYNETAQAKTKAVGYNYNNAYCSVENKPHNLIAFAQGLSKTTDPGP